MISVLYATANLVKSGMVQCAELACGVHLGANQWLP
ncbi:hypothetical protein COLO4_35830 [Corchorus olitorius]|uniref:Uncharacterized protein n=1 Tax=Corchorus olitorius TaxID=93759 RepID=A0A1R3GD26_9ROSI|nr:hypothetical protein COLO4_35830 [Corchorus olitorius]